MICITLKTSQNKSLPLFNINACSLNKNFDENKFDIQAISETRITNHYSN